ncbi:AAA family ATPase [Streptomyces sp. NPDC004783]|uniref:AAA family ATPase n=1 Tax=Streptomyces sp. NPDC004783 TaxID=3154459 RepID=UPI0033A9F224
MTGTPSSTHRRLSTATACGREDTRLVVIRGNSASGKSSVAQGLRDHYGRGIAIVGQDVIRRNVLREHDTARGASIALLGRIAREALNAGFNVVLEGILYADRYGHMITSLVRDHCGVSSCYYLDVPLETTLVRHASKADAALPTPGIGIRSSVTPCHAMTPAARNCMPNLTMTENRSLSSSTPVSHTSNAPLPQEPRAVRRTHRLLRGGRGSRGMSLVSRRLRGTSTAGWQPASTQAPHPSSDW